VAHEVPPRRYTGDRTPKASAKAGALYLKKATLDRNPFEMTILAVTPLR
jgi:hypothetical protein